MANTIYITTAIAYVNAPPHIGHALEFIQADAIARYQRLLGRKVYFQTGTDENSLNTVRAAERAGVPIERFVEENAERFKALKELQGLSYDGFIRTTESRHVEGAQKLWRACRSGDLYQKVYKGLYCVGCENFLTDKDLVDGRCSSHQTIPEPVEEQNYFFRLSAYRDRLHDLIASDRLRIVPVTRKNELMSFIASGLEDFSVSRSCERARRWGVPVPGDGSQIMYVWFDALSNYITGLGYAGHDALFDFWWVKNSNILHVIGKDIIRFHALYWPAMLLSAGLNLPREIFVHGFVTSGGTKMSKTLGNVIDPETTIRKYGIDPVRYFLLREIPATEDGDFSYERLEKRYNAELANSLGNLLNRSVSMVERYQYGILRRALPGAEPSLQPAATAVVRDYQSAMDAYELHSATAIVWQLINSANLFIQENKPWELSKNPNRQQELEHVLYEVCEALRLVSVLLWPIIPGTAEKIWRQVGMSEPLEEQQLAVAATWGLLPDGTKVQKSEIIFPRLEVSKS
ncbi:MAG: methionine--tRNA ligase [Acidobacteria bacterium]|nr:methionine--tRNA ligase [Acidobacteriota bacterium]MBI3655929.1 methionine--tRNA ligase [Acidobacteriota bacterium]